jgi:cell division protein FtsB
MGTLIRFRRKPKPQDGAARPLFPPFRSLAPGTDARPANFPSDASPTPDVPRAGRTVDPELERKRRRRHRGTIALLSLVFLGGVAAALFGDRGYLDVARQRTKRLEMKQEFDAHLKRIQALKRDVDRLKSDPFAVERIAREQLGYVARDEVTLLLPGEDPADASLLDAGRGSAIVPAVRSTP